MRYNSVIHWFFGLDIDQELIIEKQKRLRHLLHEQIRNTDNIKKILRKNPASVPVPKKKKKI